MRSPFVDVPPELAALRQLWQASADLVRADLEATTDLRWPLLIGAADLRPGHPAFLVFPYGSTGTNLEEAPAEAAVAEAVSVGDLPAGASVRGLLTAQLADMVSEDVIEELRWPWPECNVHGRPMEPTPVGPTGTRQCPKDPAHAAPIGGLAGMVGARRLLDFT
jgi:hypothetical protein